MHPPPLLLVVGDPGHGVTAYARDLAAATTLVDPRVRVAWAPDAENAARIAASAERVHLHVTERLFGATPEAAAEAIERLGVRGGLTLTLHDVPQASDGTPLPRRIAAYERMLRAADGAVVNSIHERLLVAEHLDTAHEPEVIPLAVRADRPAAAVAPPRDGDLVVGLAGYVYPGKGHAAAVRAAASAVAALPAGERPRRVVVRAIGGASRGHEGDIAPMRAHAEGLGVEFEVTGFLDDADFARHIREVGIPLAAHEHVSASRSLLDWGEAGRRPLVVRSRYAEESALLRPGTLELYDPDDLAGALLHAWRNPESTVLAPDIPLAHTLRDAARAYLAWWMR
jgi:hypothetical protein